MDICFKCLSINFDNGICKSCQSSNTEENNKPFLPKYTKIKDRFILGDSLKSTSNELFYNGYDNHKKTFVVIKEFFPTNIVKRVNNKVVPFNYDLNLNYKNLLNDYKEFYFFFFKSKNVNLEKILDIIEDENNIFIISNLDKFITLKEKLSEKIDNINEKISFEIIKDISLSVMKIHDSGFIHGKIGPNTIGFDSYGNLLIKDFINLNNPCFSPEYDNLSQFFLAPEQISFNQTGTFTDIYSIASLYYYILSGTYTDSYIKNKSIPFYFDFNSFKFNVSLSTKKLLIDSLQTNINDRIQNLDEFLSILNKTQNNNMKNSNSIKQKQEYIDNNINKKSYLKTFLISAVLTCFFLIFLLLFLFKF
ncbi:MAG: protein kinase domain-containing protein [Oscillospiraceae bacterium]